MRGQWRARTPNCDVIVDESLNIVLVDVEATLLTVTNVDALVDALRTAQTMVKVYEEQYAAARAALPPPIRWAERFAERTDI